MTAWVASTAANNDNSVPDASTEAKRLEVESLRARWFQIYTLVFGGIVALLFLFGLTESRVLGFIGLSRLLVTYIQLTMAILPIFVRRLGSQTRMSAAAPGSMTPLCARPNMRAGVVQHVSTQRSRLISPATTPW